MFFMFNIAIMGFGVVGSGVWEVIKENSKDISKKLGGEGENLIDVKYILDLRTFEGHELADRVTTDINAIINDKSVSVVVETMGGSHPAYEFSKAALESGKSVVTSNKECVAKYGKELSECAVRNGVSYLYEASVGGGIPIINAMLNALTANKIVKIAGILNGTTNYILTQMKDCGADFDSALKEAQRLGYAEANPAADVEGLDALRKICILGGIAFNCIIPTEMATPVKGITEITLEDTAFAEKMGYAIKLLGVAEKIGEKIKLLVAPHFVCKSSLIAATSDVFNAISVTGNVLGESIFYGAGAGSLPTASAVAADVIEAIRCKPLPMLREYAEEGFVLSEDEIPTKLFVRSKKAIEGYESVEINGEYGTVLPEATYGEQKKIIAESGVISSYFVL